MQPSFQIRPAEKASLVYNQCTLIVDAGERHFSFVLYSGENNEFVALEYYQFSARQKQEELKELLSSNTLLQLEYHAIHIFYNSPGGLIVPERFYDEDTSSKMLELVAGDLHASMPLFDQIESLNMRNIYAVPDYLHDLLVSQFPKALFEHIHTGLLKKNLILERKDSRMEIIFYPELIIVSLWGSGSLQFVQCFSYETPEDVTYHVVNISEQWELSRDQIRVIVSGLVEIDAALYAAVDKYFQFVETDERPEAFNYDPAFERYPAHFFSPIFSLGLCVS